MLEKHSEMLPARVSHVPALTPRGATTTEARYAIYYAPRRDSLWWLFGCAWFGRDAITDTPMSRVKLPLYDDESLVRMTSVPCRYGFHATLKAPFRLTPDYRPQDLYARAASLAVSLQAAPVPTLQLTEIDDFVALSFDDASTGATACNAIAAQCVADFEPLRAPLNATELARRTAAGLSLRQSQLLAAWGYPYVFDAFRFHFTLTGPLTRPQRRCVLDALTPLIAELQQEALELDALWVYRQSAPQANLVAMRRYGFDGSVAIYRHG